MSWTIHKDTAQWFANRFNITDGNGYARSAIACKKDVLAYFKQEDEIVISVKSLKDIQDFS